MNESQTKKRFRWDPVALVILLALAFAGGFLVNRYLPKEEQTAAPTAAPETIWTCSMHPQIQQPKPGLCPICNMDLIPLEEADDETEAERQVSYAPAAVKLMEVQTTPVERKYVEAPIRMVGKIDYDETRLKHIAAWVPGRIDRLYVDFTGTRVIKGDHMVYLYSPELISAQAEFLQALKAWNDADPAGSELIRKTTKSTLESAREKLRLLGLTQKQIEQIAAEGKPDDHITINAPMEGIVIRKHVTEGRYVEKGSPLYTIADLTHLWARLDAYESDLIWLRYGQDVTFETEAYPGVPFQGRISFISPVVNPDTRTVKVRVNIDNHDGKLKPDMFVRAVVRSPVADSGRVMEPELADKWICPMHPSIVKEEKAACDICGMDLVTTESLGYETTDTDKPPPLVIPDTAPLITGKRAVVYVRLPDTDKPTFQGREVVLGPRAGEYYLVREGLTEGDIVVTHGNFRIDADLQIKAKPSMMNPAEENGAMEHHQHESAAQTEIEQTHCPVMGNPIDKDVFVEYGGKKVYFCCPGCDETFLKDPEKYLDKLPQFSPSQETNP